MEIQSTQRSLNLDILAGESRRCWSLVEHNAAPRAPWMVIADQSKSCRSIYQTLKNKKIATIATRIGLIQWLSFGAARWRITHHMPYKSREYCCSCSCTVILSDKIQSWTGWRCLLIEEYADDIEGDSTAPGDWVRFSSTSFFKYLKL